MNRHGRVEYRGAPCSLLPAIYDSIHSKLLQIFTVTRYDDKMKSTASPGKNAVGMPASPAERMRRYRARRRAAGMRLERRWVAGGEPTAHFSDHRLLELRSLALHAAIARKVRGHPELIDRARANLERWMAAADDGGRAVLEEWRGLLDLPVADLLRVMVDWNEAAIRLRQSSPFAGILNPSERKAIYEAFRA